MAKRINNGRCCCCGRAHWLTFHHLIPRKMHRRNYFKKRYSKTELAQGIMVCRQCHNGIHRFYDEMTLGKTFSTLESLKADPRLREYFAWVARQKIKPGGLV